MLRNVALPAALLLLLQSTATACLWDHDTLRQERAKFPNTLELTTGKFLRHSPEFYQWRITDRRKRLVARPDDLALRDDLIVALSLLNRHDEAIAEAHESARKQPGRYETESNLGTVLIRAGKLEEGVVHIREALKINPDAHFGREKYQVLLVEHALSKKTNGVIPLPLVSEVEIFGGNHGFAKFVCLKLSPPLTPETRAELSDTDRMAALKGIQGMMRSGNHENLLLLEAQASLLAYTYRNDMSTDAKQLAARSYLRAAELETIPSSQTAYRRLAGAVLDMQVVRGHKFEQSLNTLKLQFRKERADADTWYAALREREIGWIRDGKDPEAEFDAQYVIEPDAIAVDEGEYGRNYSIVQTAMRFACGGSCLGVLVLSCSCIVLRLRFLRRRRMQQIKDSPAT